MAWFAAVAPSARAQHNGTAVTLEAEQIAAWLTGSFRAADGTTLRIVEVPARDADPVMLYVVQGKPGTPIADYWLFGLRANAGRTAAEDHVRLRRYWVNNDFRQQFSRGIEAPETLRALRPQQLSHLAGCDIALRPRDKATYAGTSDPATCVSDTDGGPFYIAKTMELHADSLSLGSRVWHDERHSGRPSESAQSFQRVRN